MRENLAGALRLMLVTDDALLRDRSLADIAAAAVAGGVTSVQVRLKRAPARELAEVTRALLRRLAVPVLVNDRADVALATGAAGVHLGADDPPVALIRRIAPPGFVIGASVGLEAEVANGLDADYWGIGPFRATGTKADAGAALGAAGFAALCARAGSRPCVAIGAVRPEDVADALGAGAAGVAVVSGILAAPDVAQAARRYRQALDRIAAAGGG